MPRTAVLLIVLLIVLLAVACVSPPAQAGDPAVPPPPPAGADAQEAEPEPDTRERLERMRGTGSRAGFDHDTRPRGPLAQQFGTGRRRAQAEEEAPAVAPRPTRWREESVGGTEVHQVRFRRRGEDRDDG